MHNLADTGEGGISIHWHGLAMRDANEMDGVVGLTQCAIGLGRSYTYRFRIADTQHGTFWYHAHSGVQLADGLYGGLVVHQPSSSREAALAGTYDREQLLLVGDWYHRPARDVLAKYQDHSSFGNEVGRLLSAYYTWNGADHRLASSSPPRTPSWSTAGATLRVPWPCRPIRSTAVRSRHRA